MSILTLMAIETSCDETAVSIVQSECTSLTQFPDRVRVLAHQVESQTEIHQPFGGVVPEIAARDHLAKIHGIAKNALAESGLPASALDGLAVTMGPGLIGALMVGVLFARGLALALGIPLHAVNHVDAHLAPALLMPSFSPRSDLGRWFETPHLNFPALSLTVSGGHCMLSLVRSHTERQILGRTADDACGEAFDKIAKLLGLPYPGGPEIERLAAIAGGSRFSFPAAINNRDNRHGFSFSGVKTAVLECVRKQTGQTLGKISGAGLSPDLKCEIAWAFQEAAIGQLVDRLQNALTDHKDIVRCALVAGGVAANTRFRTALQQLGVPVHFAPLALCSDNATMIALQAFLAAADGFAQQPFARYTDTRISTP